MSNINGYKIKLLSDENYDSWRLRMQSVLVLNGVWGYVSGETKSTEETQTTWNENDRKALSIIRLVVSTKKLRIVLKATSSKEAWNLLKSSFESSGLIR